jgi:signal transduction histidine kinase
MMLSYREITQACDELVTHSQNDIRDAVANIEAAMDRLSMLVTAEALLTAFLGIALLWLLYTSVFAPLRHIAAKLRSATVDGEAQPGPEPAADEPHALAYYLQTLMTQVSSTRADFAKGQEELVQKRRLAEIGNTVARIAHDIRNAMSCIGGYARMIEKRPDNTPQVRNDAGVIFRTAVQLEQTLQEMMDYSRPAIVETRVQSPNAAVAAALNAVGGQRPGHVTIDADLDPAAPAVPCDAHRLERVVVNLVRNAIDALSDRKTGHILVRTRPRDGGGAAIAVQDDGPGIPPEVQPRLFEPFFTTKRKGSGLGLSICRQIVGELGGEILLDSSPGGGTTFTIVLPPAGAKAPPAQPGAAP